MFNAALGCSENHFMCDRPMFKYFYHYYFLLILLLLLLLLLLTARPRAERGS